MSLTPDPTTLSVNSGPTPPVLSNRASSNLLSRLSGKHTAGSAAILLMLSAILSGLLGLVRIKVINSLWGAGPEQDA